MQYLNNTHTVCLTYAEFVPAILAKSAFDLAKHRGTITVHGRGGNGREVLIEFESLPFKYKNLVVRTYGDPYKYISQQPVLQAMEHDTQAQEFYTAFTLPNGRKLPEEHVTKYTQAASWLNTICRFTTNKRELKQALNISLSDFWATVTDLIRTHKVALPVSEKRLKERIKAYRADKYASLIELHRFGNDNSKKVSGIAETLLIQLIANANQHDDTVIAAQYNSWAAAHNHPLITAGTVGYRRLQNMHLVTQGREGNSVNYMKYSPQILRNRPSAPLLFVNSDDNVFDLYFKEDKGGRTSHYYRPALYVVVDAYNDYILGYAIGDTVTVDLVKAAYRNAMQHVMELTGNAYCWQQIQTDRWQIDPKLEGPLASWFKAQATFTPATAKVAQAKYIERTFGTTWHQQLKFFLNYAGQNITSKQRLNPDAVAQNKAEYPDKSEAPAMAETFINRMRQLVNPATGNSRQQDWLEAFKASEKSKKKLLSPELRLQLFGVEHSQKNRLTAAGLEFTLNRKKLQFAIPQELYLENVGKAVQVIYDPYDFSQVLVTDGKGLRFVAKEFEKVPSALADFEEGDRIRLNNLLDQKKRVMETIGQATQQRAEQLKRAGVDAESLLQAGVKNKELRHDAERLLTGGSIQLIPDTDDTPSIYSLM